MFRKEKKQVASLHIFEKKCTGCEKCVSHCRPRVLGMIYKEDRSYATVEFLQRCVGCGKCTWVCPVDAIELILV